MARESESDAALFTAAQDNDLAKATDQVFASEGYRALVQKTGFELFGFDDRQTAAFIKTEVEKWAAVAKSANIRID